MNDESEVSASDLLSRRMSGGGIPPACDGHPRREVEVLGADDEEDFPALVEEQLRQYQALAARLNYFSMDRADLLFSVKELMRRLSRTSEEDWTKLKRCARYLLSAPRLVILFPWKPLADTLRVFTDADHAGCHRTRKSTSGGAVVWGQCLLKAWSRTQTLIALSSGESSLAAVTKAAAEGFGVQAVLSDFGFPVKIEVHSDATAAIGIADARGWAE